MEDDDGYEIIYEEGVPLIAFQICSKSGGEKIQYDNDVLANADSSFESERDQTLQYFKEDEGEKSYPENETLNTNSLDFESSLKIKEYNSPTTDVSLSHKGLDFVIVKNAWKTNSKKLHDSRGYSYTLRNVKVTESCSIWRCRFKVDGTKECGSKVKITKDNEIIILQDHRHEPDCTVPFSVLKETKVEPPKQKNYSSAGYHDSYGVMKSSKPVITENCGKMLDYFSEGPDLGATSNINELMESSYEDQSKCQSSTLQKEVMYKVVKNGSITGTNILYDSHGYSYSLLEKKGDLSTWGCQAVLSTEGNKCDAVVTQEKSTFTGEGVHSHSPKRHTLLKINKMQIFSTNENDEYDESFKRKIEKKLSSSKKMKKTFETEKQDVLALNKVKEENESFQFKTKDISFLVSIENDENEPLIKEADQTQDSQINQNKNKSSPRIATKSPPIQKMNIVSKKVGLLKSTKEIAGLAFSGTSQQMSNIKYFEGSNCSSFKLFDSRGYLYTLKNQTDNIKKHWFCGFRAEGFQCKAKLTEVMHEFVLERDHSHEPEKEKFIRALIKIDLLKAIKEPSSKHRSGMNLVKEVISSYGINFPFNFKPGHLVRYVNYQKKSSADQLEDEYKCSFNRKKIPKNFLLQKIMVDQKFHLTFANEIQLAYLASASEWYIDETDFNIESFTSLLSIHVFIEQNGSPVQIPVFFAIVSERRESDYTQVFSSIKSSLNKPPIVTSIIIDLNVPLRKSLSKGFPNAEIKCCDFHWSEDIACKIKEMDLSNFLDDPVAMQCLYQLPLLNLLPRQDFEIALGKIERESEDESVGDLICYIRETFGDRSLWPPKYWSSFKMPIQVNSHQLWRKDLLKKNSNLELYSFIRTLYSLSNSINENLKLMSKKKIKKHYNSHPETVLSKVYKEWKLYIRGELTCHTLLENLASIIHIF